MASRLPAIASCNNPRKLDAFVIQADNDCGLTGTRAAYTGLSLDLGSHTLSPKLAFLTEVE